MGDLYFCGIIILLILMFVYITFTYSLLHEKLHRLERFMEETILKQDRTNQILEQIRTKDENAGP